MARVERTPQSREDVIAIWEYVAQFDESAADRLLERFTDLFARLAELPRMGARQDQHRAGLRSMPVGRYVVIYELMDDGIRVIRVFHSAQRWEDQLASE